MTDYSQWLREPSSPPPKKLPPAGTVILEGDQISIVRDASALKASEFAAQDRNVSPAALEAANRYGMSAEMATAAGLDKPKVDHEKLARENPKVAQWLKNPDNYAMARDNIEDMSYLERQLAFIGEKWEEGNRTVEMANRGEKLFREIWFSEPVDAANRARIAELRARQTKDYGITGFWEDIPGVISNQIPIQFQTLLGSARATAVGAASGAAVGAGIGSLAGGVGAIPGAATGSALGAGVGWRYGAGVAAARMEGSLALVEYMAEMDDAGVRTIDDETAAAAAFAVGLVNGGLEMLGVEQIIARIPQVKMLSRSGVKELLKSPTTRAVFARFGKTVGQAMATEGITEFLQEMVTHTGKVLAEGNASTPDELIAQILDPEAVARALEAGEMGLKSAGGMAVVAAAPEAVAGYVDARRAEQVRQAWVQAGERLKKVPLTQQGPIEEMTQGAPNVFIPSEQWNVYWQSQGVDPREVAKEVMGSTKAYDDAVAAGADIPIPTASYARKIAATEHNAFFADELRMSPEQLSAREMRDQIKNLDALAEADNDELMQELTSRLRGAGFDAQTSDDYASQMAAALTQLSKRSGIMTPMQMLQKYGLDVSRAGLPVDVGASTMVDQGEAPATREQFIALGDAQRGVPESKMIAVQRASGGGVLNGVVEHVGDLTHRMADRNTLDTFGYEFVREKVEKTLRTLTSRYGFEREFNENLRNNAKYWAGEGKEFAPGPWAESLDSLTAEVDKRLAEYAEAHAALPVYNDAQRFARDAAVALGNKDWWKAVDNLRELEKHLGSREEWVKFAGQNLQQTLDQGPINPDEVNQVRLAKDGRMFGGPEGLTTKKEYNRIVREMVKLAMDPMAAPTVSMNWYEESGRYIAALSHGDAQLQERMLRLVAFFSRATHLGGNAKFMVDAAYQLARGEELRVGRFPNAARAQLEAIFSAPEMNKSVPGVNDKVMSFYRNLKDGATGLNQWPDESTIDRWMWQSMGYTGDREHSAGSAQYAFARQVMIDAAKEVSKKLGRTVYPRQLQAMLWTYERNTESYKELSKEARKSFRPESIHLGDYLENATAMVNFEAVPSTSTGLYPLFNSLPAEQKQAFLRDALALTTDLPTVAGIPLSMTGEGRGMWEGVTNPNAYTALTLEGGVTSGYDTKQAQLVSSLLGYIYQQDAVLWHRPALFGTKRPKNAAVAVSILVKEGQVDPGALGRFLHEKAGVIGFSQVVRPDGVVDFRALRLPGEKESRKVATQLDEEFRATIEQALNAFETDAVLEPRAYTVEYGMPSNDWKENPNGEGYLGALGEVGRPDLQQWADDRRARFQELLAEHVRRAEQSAAEAITTLFQSGRGEQPAVRGDARLSAPPVRADGRVELVHWSRAPGVEQLDPAYHGRGIAGAESTRKVNDARNWVDRTYYGLGVGQPGGYVKEAALGAQRYVTSVDPSELYDWVADPDGIKPTLTEAGTSKVTEYEKRIRDAGYKGYWVAHPQLGLTAAVFEALPVEMQGVVEEMAQPAYHGSPYTFDEFKLQHIGTGEGAQAYGWGLYFSSKREVAEWYKPSPIDVVAARELSPEELNAFSKGMRALIDQNGDFDAAKTSLRKQLSIYRRRAKNVTSPIEKEELEFYFIPNTEKALEMLDSGAYKVKKGSGRLYTVDIPEQADMLDWDKPLSEQSEKVQDIVRRAFPGTELSVFNGQQLYESLVRDESAAGKKAFELASKALLAAGIPGLTYKGQTSGERNFVVFDDSLVKITEMEQTRRGYIQIAPNRTLSIGLLENADLSTFIHESGHAYLEIFRDLVAQIRALPADELTEAQKQMLDDADTITSWMGIKSLDEIQVEHHEQWARGFEAYAMEGKAPSVALRRAFARFRTWLVALYRSITGLNVKLNDDVRAVFDRMLASDEEIEAARNETAAMPAFTDAISAGMSEREFAAYRKKVEDASNAARENLERKLMDEYTREREMWWQERKAEVQETVEQELIQRREYAARETLRKGKTPAGDPVPKLNTVWVRENRPEMANSLRPYTRKDGASPTELAPLFGFASGDELLDALADANLLPYRQAVEAETQRRMLAQYGDMRNDGTLADKAKQAVLDDHRSEIIEEELKAIEKLRRQAAPVLEAQRKDRAEAKRKGVAMLRSIPSVEVIRRVARGRVEQTQLKDLQPGQWLVAARRASAAAQKALIEEDYHTAALQKQRELLSVEMYREVNKARERADNSIAYLRSMQRPKVRGPIAKAGQGILAQIDALVAGIDLSRPRRPQGAFSASTFSSYEEFLASMQAAGQPVNDDILRPAQTLSGRPYRELTVEELYGLRDAVKHLQTLARFKNKLLRLQAKAELDATAAELESTAARTSRGKRPLRIETELPQDRAGKWLSGFLASMRKMSSLAREMDGGVDGGPFWESLIRPLTEAADHEMTMRMEAAQKLQELLSPYLTLPYRVGAKVVTLTKGLAGAGMFKEEFIPEIGGRLSKQGRLMVALNWGNDLNRMRLMDGYGWNEAQVEAILDGLTEQDWQVVQGIWDLIDSYWPQIKALAERIDGVAPEKVEAVPVQTKYGPVRGGYFPIKYNGELSPRAHELSAKEQAEAAMKGAGMRSTTKHGFRKERVQASLGKEMKVRLDFGAVHQHLNDVIHDLTHYEALVDVNRVMKHPATRRAFNDYYGHDVYRQFERGIMDVAAGDVGATTSFERAVNHLRTGVSISAMGFNFMTSLIQPLGFTQSIVRIGPTWVWRGMTRWLRDTASFKSAADMIRAKSPFMQERSRTMIREINEVRSRMEGDIGIVAAAFWPIAKMQQIVDVPTWLGAYEKAYGTDVDMTEERAVALADQAVRDSQGGGQVVDLAQIQRGSPLMKLWTNFYSFFNVTYNLASESIAQVRSVRDMPKLVADFLMLYTVPAVLGYLLTEALRGDLGDEEPDELAMKLLQAQLAYIFGTVVGLRELGGAVQGYAGYEGPAGARGFAELAGLAKQVGQGEVDEAAVKAAANAAGILLHLPATQTIRSVEGMIEYQKSDDATPLILLTGPERNR